MAIASVEDGLAVRRDALDLELTRSQGRRHGQVRGTHPLRWSCKGWGTLVRGSRCFSDFLLRGHPGLRGGQAVEAGPAGFLPGKDQAAVGHPDELVTRGDTVKERARARTGSPEFAAAAGGYIGNADGPRRALTQPAFGNGGDERHFTDEGNALAIRRPDRVVVQAGAGVQPAQLAHGKGVQADEAMVAAMRDEEQLCAIG